MKTAIRVVAAADIVLLAAAAFLGGIAINANSDRKTRVESLASDMGVTIVWSRSTPCSKATSCYAYATPNMIYVDPQAPDPADAALTEIAHVIQHRAGMGQDECQAGRIVDNFPGIESQPLHWTC